MYVPLFCFPPQVYDTHYFNLLHLFGFRGGKGQYEISVNDQTSGNVDDMSAAVMDMNDGEEMIDFTLRSSNANGNAKSLQPHSNGNSNASHSYGHNQSQRSNGSSSSSHKNGLIIEHRHIGR